MGLTAKVKAYVERNYPGFHLHVDTECDVHMAALKFIFNHTYKGK